MYSYDPAEELHEAEQELLSDMGDLKVRQEPAEDLLCSALTPETRAWFCPQPSLGLMSSSSKASLAAA